MSHQPSVTFRFFHKLVQIIDTTPGNTHTHNVNYWHQMKNNHKMNKQPIDTQDKFINPEKGGIISKAYLQQKYKNCFFWNCYLFMPTAFVTANHKTLWLWIQWGDAEKFSAQTKKRFKIIIWLDFSKWIWPRTLQQLHLLYTCKYALINFVYEH